MKSNAIRIYEYGGPEVLTWEEVDVPAPIEGQVQIRHTAIGLNFIDVYHRTGLYPTELPAGLGSEAAGVVEVVHQWLDRRNCGQADNPVAYFRFPLDAAHNGF